MKTIVKAPILFGQCRVLMPTSLSNFKVLARVGVNPFRGFFMEENRLSIADVVRMATYFHSFVIRKTMEF